MDEDNVSKSNTYKTAEGIVKGNTAFRSCVGSKYNVIYNTSKSTIVNIKKGNSWAARFDLPHKGVPTEHINLNSKITGFPDPHIPVPAGTAQAVKTATQVGNYLNKANKVLVPVAIGVNIVQTGFAINEDVERGTSRNTVETLANVGGGWAGGYAGATACAAVGTAIMPVVGTLVGGLIGGIAGGIGGSLAAGEIVDAIGDACDYDLEEAICECCNKRFKARKYKNEKICQKCR